MNSKSVPWQETIEELTESSFSASKSPTKSQDPGRKYLVRNLTMDEDVGLSAFQSQNPSLVKNVGDSLQLNAIEVVDDGAVDLLAIIRKVGSDVLEYFQI